MGNYILSYVSGSTGYARTTETDSLKDAFMDCEYYRHNYTAYFSVYSKISDAFIFRKPVLTYTPEIDKISGMVTRHQKYYWKKQNEIRMKAIDYDFRSDNDPVTTQAYFRKMAKRFGLVQEFTENAII